MAGPAFTIPDLPQRAGGVAAADDVFEVGGPSGSGKIPATPEGLGAARADFANAEAALMKRMNFGSSSFGAAAVARAIPPLSDEVPNITVTGPGGPNPIVGGVDYLYNTPNVNRIGCYPVLFSQFGTDYHQNQCNGLSGAGAMPWAVEFDTGAADITIPFRPATSSARIWIWVKGRPITPDPMTFDTFPPVAAGSKTWLRIRLGWAARRRVRVYLINCDFGGISVPAGYDVVANPVAESDKIAYYGDSWGLAADFPHSVGWLLGRALGAQPFMCSIAGTGYATASGFGSAFRTTPLFAIAPRLIAVCGSINDDPNSPAVISANAAAFFADIAANLPATKLIVFGPQPVPAGYVSMAARLANRDAVKAAALAAPNVIRFVDPIEERWLYGTGRIGAQTGDGNADLYLGPDVLHPGCSGADYYVSRMVDNVKAGSESLSPITASIAPSVTPTAPALP